MKNLRVGEWLTIGALALAGVVWLVRLEGRVNLQDRALTTYVATTRESGLQLREDVAYIRRRLDEIIDRGAR